MQHQRQLRPFHQKIKNKNKNKNIKRKGAGCVVPARLCSLAVVHHQLLGVSGLPISLTQPQLRPDPNREWEGKHEVARSSICALTPSAVKPPLFLSFGSLLQLCITSFWVWEELPNSATPSLSCDLIRIRNGKESTRLLVGAFVRLRPLL